MRKYNRNNVMNALNNKYNTKKNSKKIIPKPNYKVIKLLVMKFTVLVIYKSKIINNNKVNNAAPNNLIKTGKINLPIINIMYKARFNRVNS